jgi:metal-dependent amidase/aminoacylase/carboxypeptidase family protein
MLGRPGTVLMRVAGLTRNESKRDAGESACGKNGRSQDDEKPSKPRAHSRQHIRAAGTRLCPEDHMKAKSRARRRGVQGFAAGGLSCAAPRAPWILGAEDFSYMLEARPGAFIFVGNGDTAGLHHPAYDFNDETIPFGTSYWVRLIEKAMPA